MWNVLKADEPMALDLPLVKDVILGYKFVSFHSFDSAFSDEPNGNLSYALFRVREPVSSVTGFKLASVSIDQCPATLANGSFLLALDMSSAAPSCYTN
jgi:hypothetical protein